MATILQDIERGDLDAVRSALDGGFHPDTPLGWALTDGASEAADILRAAGADPALTKG